MATCCDWDEVQIPTTQTEALGLSHHAEDLLEVVERDNQRWMSLLRCKVCGKPWCEDSMDSGQMTASFVYPIRAEDPAAWFANAEPLNPSASDVSGWGFPS